MEAGSVTHRSTRQPCDGCAVKYPLAQLPQRVALLGYGVRVGWYCDGCAGEMAEGGWFVVSFVSDDELAYIASR